MFQLETLFDDASHQYFASIARELILWYGKLRRSVCKEWQPTRDNNATIVLLFAFDTTKML